MKALLAIFLLAFAIESHAQRMEEGNWEFVTEIATPGLPRPQQSGKQACLTRDQARDPLHWAGATRLPSDCRVGTLKLGPDVTSWDFECPGSGMRGAGRAQISRNNMSSELELTGGLRTKTRGQRVGPCTP